MRDVAGHLLVSTQLSRLSFCNHLARTGFILNRMIEADVKQYSSNGPSSFAAQMPSGALRRSHPPGPATAMLGKAVVHGEDVRRPLGVDREFPSETLVMVADFYKGSSLLIGAKRRISGLRLEATDAAWANGDGLVVTGTLLSLILAMTGRRQVYADLAGEGSATFATRP